MSIARNLKICQINFIDNMTPIGKESVEWGLLLKLFGKSIIIYFLSTCQKIKRDKLITSLYLNTSISLESAKRQTWRQRLNLMKSKEKCLWLTFRAVGIAQVFRECLYHICGVTHFPFKRTHFTRKKTYTIYRKGNCLLLQ